MIRFVAVFFILGWTSSFAVAQSCVDNIIATTETGNYQINVEGTATDKHNKITWARCAIGQTWQNNKCIGEASLVSWDQAKIIANEITFASFNDWRLPSIHELSGISELSCQNPAISLQLFPDTPSLSFWTNTEFVNDKNNAWQVYFGSGENHTAKKTTAAAVRLVRTVTN
jgi:hypothetical protein